MRASPSVLLVEDSPSLAEVYSVWLEHEGVGVTAADTGKKALEILARSAPSVILLDLGLPDMDGIDILRRVKEQDSPSLVIVVTAKGSVKTAVEAMQLGAYDFIVKPCDKDRLVVTVRNALDRQTIASQIDALRDDLDRDQFCGMVGSSLPMQAVYRIIESAAPSKATVFVTGESGTGKELCAQAVHRLSPRAARPFVALNCGAIPKDLIESEIFGHVKGAFTGAQTDRDGAAQRAHGGTLFLDEICEMDLSLQTKLLRFIQTGTVQKVGGDAPQPVDVRFICATNRDPWTEVEAGTFREDLYYRLHVIPIHLPPLRERDKDVLEIARRFLVAFAKEEKRGFRSFSVDSEAVLRRFDWPGNVRQLQNVIRNIVVLNDAETVTPDMLPAPLNSLATASAGPAHPPDRVPVTVNGEIAPLWQVEKAAIEHAIDLCDGNIPRAAAMLEISPSTIYRKKIQWEQAEDAGG